MKEALKQIIDLLQPVAALVDGTPFEHSEVIQRCVDASEITLEALAQLAQKDCGCAECGKKEKDGWYLYCVECMSKTALAQPEQETFTKHNVEQPSDWSDWVCPDPNGYLMKCCDCGLVHETEFSVVRYKSETEREDCDIVNDPNLQAVFRMRRSEQWSTEDTAHRAGGMPMEQPEQEPDYKLLFDAHGITE